MPKLLDEEEVVCVKRMLVDKRIKPVIDWLNAVPNIITIYSCSGHKSNHWALEIKHKNGSVTRCTDGAKPYVSFIVTCERFNPSVKAIIETLKKLPWIERFHYDKNISLWNQPIAIYFHKPPTKKLLKKSLMELIGEQNIKD